MCYHDTPPKITKAYTEFVYDDGFMWQINLYLTKIIISLIAPVANIPNLLSLYFVTTYFSMYQSV